MDAERLGRVGDLPHELLAAGLGRQGGRPLQERLARAGGDDELEAGQEDADDQGEHMFAPIRMRGKLDASGRSRPDDPGAR
jgi:hypothetical protein